MYAEQLFVIFIVDYNFGVLWRDTRGYLVIIISLDQEERKLTLASLFTTFDGTLGLLVM